MTELMRGAAVSLIFKHKGERTAWSNYRPISVTAAEYKILAKAMQLALAEELPRSALRHKRKKKLGWGM